ncbi:type I-E CRISPR-associated protein Cas6/Cse3/CasE [Streptomyces olivaceoviridis]|uniref:type I-E CRISPR-associated protein Cas6/Cse3/CasE n=1 Tax=Streptomyces olivaceoviridis TaxID=1921 RepID=UPI003681C754
MYLTRARINVARPGARRLLGSPQALHAAVMSSFPSLLPEDPSATPAQQQGPRVLWRLDRNKPAEVFLYIVSPDRPDLTHIVEQAGWPAAAAADPATPGWETRPYGPFLDRLTTGSIWAFRLTANPVHYIRRKDGEPTKRTAHVTATHQMGWLLDEARQERCGFRILEKPQAKRLLPTGTTHSGHAHHGDRYELIVRDRRNLSFAKAHGSSNAGKAPVSLVTVTYDGHLQVTEPERMRRMLVEGLGKAKAYGCGLMTLVPLPRPSKG